MSLHRQEVGEAPNQILLRGPKRLKCALYTIIVYLKSMTQSECKKNIPKDNKQGSVLITNKYQ